MRRDTRRRRACLKPSRLTLDRTAASIDSSLLRRIPRLRTPAGAPKPLTTPPKHTLAPSKHAKTPQKHALSLLPALQNPLFRARPARQNTTLRYRNTFGVNKTHQNPNKTPPFSPGQLYQNTTSLAFCTRLTLVWRSFCAPKHHLAPQKTCFPLVWRSFGVRKHIAGGQTVVGSQEPVSASPGAEQTWTIWLFWIRCSVKEGSRQ